ncbi:MAG: FtsW/RodA/SpoVE family cell cycle protein [Lentisphaeria bacterium]|nr:FtsW/RodA/SpoVE family cell cycle protein [Lentisphaeria bacterium]
MNGERKPLPRPAPTPSVWRFRGVERLLLFLGVLAIGAANGAILVGSMAAGEEISWHAVLPLGLFLASALWVHGALLAAGSRCDPVLPALALILTGMGLVLRTRFGGWDHASLTRPATYAVPVGVLGMVVLAIVFRRGRWAGLAGWRWVCLGSAAVLLLAMRFAGHRYRGGYYGAGNTNPTEIVKVLMVFFTAGFLARRGDALPRAALLPLPHRLYWGLALCWALPLGLLAWNRDLGMVMILAAVLAAMLWLATGRLSVWAGSLLGAAAAAVLALGVTAHGQRRLAAWADPFADATGTGWQALQALTAFYNGGLWGRGIGAGSPESVPVAASDFVYAVAGEELGFAGCAALLLLYGVMVVRGYRIALARRDLFGALLAGGLTTALAVQTLVNVGGVTKAIPMTGVTLPLISHGGSSLLTTFLMLGLILAVSDPPDAPAPAPPA